LPRLQAAWACQEFIAHGHLAVENPLVEIAIEPLLAYFYSIGRL
jgi:hypothetical protein